jgi:hypothetical protein
MKKILLVTLISSFILSCSTESKSGVSVDNNTINKPEYLSREEIEQRLNLPEEISIEEANSSVLGPLTDDNIRKDLKRLIGFAAPENTAEDAKTRAVYNRLAQIWTEMIQNQDDKEKLITLDYERSVIWACVINNYVDWPEEMKDFLFLLDLGSMERAIVYDKINEQLDVDFGIIRANVYEAKCDNLKNK